MSEPADPTPEILVAELQGIFSAHSQAAIKYYLQIRPRLNNPYQWPILDIVREEICHCLICGLYQAAITLTNHLLEDLLKSAIIFRLAKEEAKRCNDNALNHYEECSVNIDGLQLANSINRARKLNIITKEEKKELHELRDRLRNAYSHAEKAKIFGDTEIPIVSVKLGAGTNQDFTPKQVRISHTPFVQAFAKKQHAEDHALPYFLYVDDLARLIWNRLF